MCHVILLMPRGIACSPSANGEQEDQQMSATSSNRCLHAGDVRGAMIGELAVPTTVLHMISNMGSVLTDVRT
jgi:hypothetical protein